RALADYGSAARSEDPQVRLNAHYGRGSALFRQGKLDEARDAFKDALRADPADRDSKFNIEIIDRLQAARSSSGEGQPGQPGQPGQGAQPGQQPSQPGQPGQQPGQQPGPQPGQPGQAPGGSPPPSGAQPGGTPGESLDRALLEFRRNLTEAEAHRLLDALARDQGGIEKLLEGRPTGGDRRAPY
ncbi:MAG: tetratricopeptide repeat protein, partial [Chloroflexota bacterium]|nr:tetratricopeptide repeat protein [Chloroflexota bacterium]